MRTTWRETVKRKNIVARIAKSAIGVASESATERAMATVRSGSGETSHPSAVTFEHSAWPTTPIPYQPGFILFKKIIALRSLRSFRDGKGMASVAEVATTRIPSASRADLPSQSRNEKGLHSGFSPAYASI